MRAILTAMALSAVGLTTAPDARAEITYPWCITGSYKGGARSCAFMSLAQCNANVGPGATYCEPNAMYRPDRAAVPHRSRR